MEVFAHHQQEEEDSPLFRTDDFRIWCMKVIPCTKRFVHDWTVCPFAHAGEKAVRRDPRTNNYTGIACPDMKKNTSCIRGDRCPYAHNVFEYWLHPTRYRTQLCNDGPTCRRGICFFAHSLDELRVPACKPYVSPEALARASLEAIHQNPHPLGAQLPNSFNPSQGQAPTNGMMTPEQAAQHAAMAALNGMTSIKHGQPNGMHPTSNIHGQVYAMMNGQVAPPPSETPPPYMADPYATDNRQQHVPRISEYGSLPRWSDNSRFSKDYSHSARQSFDHFGSNRVSHDLYGSSVPNSEQHFGSYGAGRMSHSHDIMAENAAAAATLAANLASATPRNSTEGALHAPSYSPTIPRSVSNPDSLSNQDTTPRSSADDSVNVNAAAAHLLRCITLAEGMAAPNGDAAARSSNGGSGSLPCISESELAQSLASLKIALTQQNIASSTGTNHEIVISTLHQILKGAIAQQDPPTDSGTGSGRTSDSGIEAVVINEQQQNSSSPPSSVFEMSSNPSLESNAAEDVLAQQQQHTYMLSASASELYNN